MTRTRKPKPLTVTPQMVLKHLRGKRAKYGNRRVVTPYGTFDSVKEHKRWLQLEAMEQDGQIQSLKRQMTYELKVNKILVCKFVADHVYIEDGHCVVEDVKSPATRKNRAYSIKRKLMKAIFNITIREV